MNILHRIFGNRSHVPPRPCPEPPPRPKTKPEATIAGHQVTLMAIQELPSTAVLVVDTPPAATEEDCVRIRGVLMTRLNVRDVLVFCGGVKLAGVYDVQAVDLRCSADIPSPLPNKETRDGDPHPR